MQSIERALDAAVLVVGSGGSTAAADRTFAQILQGYGQKNVSTVWRLDSVAATHLENGVSTTFFRPIGTIAPHLVRASWAVALGRKVSLEGAGAVDIPAEIARIRALSSPYARWVTILAAAAAGAFFSRASGGDWGAFGVACVAALIGQLLRGSLQSRGVARITVTAICALVSGAVAASGLRLGLSQTVTPTLVGAIVYMVPGMPLINGCIDLASPGHTSVGFERLVDAALILLTLTIAVVLADAVLPGVSLGAS